MKYLYIAILLFLASSVQTNNAVDLSKVANSHTVLKDIENTPVNNFQFTDKTVKFLWRADKYDDELKDTFNSIFINEEYCKTITDPERAALGYVATFIGNECWWDGEANDDRSNLKCKILTALNLGYQCSDKHLGFLRQWFKDDKKALVKLENCPTTPYTSTIQDTFDEITLKVNGNEISIFFRANGVNTREGNSWSWTETDYFQVENDNLKLIKQDKSKVKQEHIEMGE